jgi:hypothetical protein
VNNDGNSYAIILDRPDGTRIDVIFNPTTGLFSSIGGIDPTEDELAEIKNLLTIDD